MYKLKYFTEEDYEKVIEFMKENSFAVITGMDDEYPVATHVPLEIKFEDQSHNYKQQTIFHRPHYLKFRSSQIIFKK